MSGRLQALALGAAALAVGASRFALRVRVPGGYDAIGFVLALRDYDLSKLQPQFPGYPVFVAFAHACLPLVGGDGLAAAALASALAAAATALGVWWVAARLGGARAGWAALALYAAAALPWMLGGAALSDGSAAALAMLAFAALCWERPALGAALIGFMLGARASYWPLAASFAALLWRARPGRRTLVRAAAAGVAATLAWAVPFVWWVGPRLLMLGRTHLVGHFTVWGGSLATRPALGLRGFAFARDLFYDGLAPSLAALTVIALCVAAARPGRPRSAALRTAAIATVPYALWAFCAQNVIDHPRHLLPLVLALTVALGWALSARPWCVVAAALAAGWAAAPVALAHCRTPSAAALAARWVAASYPPGAVVIYGGPSMRTFRYLEPKLVVRERTWLADIDVDLERLDVLPPHILVTSEVEPDAARAARLGPAHTFCRDPRLDRAQPCLSLREYALGKRMP